MKIVAKIQNAIIGVQELKGEYYFNVLLRNDKGYESVFELIQPFDKAVTKALECQNMIEFIKQ